MTTTERVSRAEQSERNRAALLSAARKVFLRDGYHATTVEAVAGEAGFTIGALYSRFDGKANLFLALLEQRIAERAQQFAGINPDGTQGPLEAARRWAEIMRSDLDWTLLVVEFRVHAARDPELAARYRVMHERSLEGLRVNVAASIPPELGATPEGIDALARSAMAASTGAALERAALGDDFSDDLYEQTVLALCEQFVGPLEP